MTENVSLAHPTDGQIAALGLLAVYGAVWVDWAISREELRQLEAMGLCHGDTVKWHIGARLAAFLPPYAHIIKAHGRAADELAKIEAQIHPYWKYSSVYHKPEGADEQLQIKMVETAAQVAQYMTELRKEIGQGLAEHWIMWSKEANDQ